MNASQSSLLKLSYHLNKILFGSWSTFVNNKMPVTASRYLSMSCLKGYIILQNPYYLVSQLFAFLCFLLLSQFQIEQWTESLKVKSSPASSDYCIILCNIVFHAAYATCVHGKLRRRCFGSNWDRFAPLFYLSTRHTSFMHLNQLQIVGQNHFWIALSQLYMIAAVNLLKQGYSVYKSAVLPNLKLAQNQPAELDKQGCSTPLVGTHWNIEFWDIVHVRCNPKNAVLLLFSPADCLSRSDKWPMQREIV